MRRGFPCCYPTSVRNPDEAHTLPVELPQEEHFKMTVKAAVYHFAEVERSWMTGIGDSAFSKSRALISVTSVTGCGEKLC